MNDYWARKITLAVAISFLIDSSTRQTKLAKCCFLYEYTIHKLATFITCHWQLVRNLILHQQAKCSFICLAHLLQIKFPAISMHADSPCYSFFFYFLRQRLECGAEPIYLVSLLRACLIGGSIFFSLKGSVGVCRRRKGREGVY